MFKVCFFSYFNFFFHLHFQMLRYKKHFFTHFHHLILLLCEKGTLKKVNTLKIHFFYPAENFHVPHFEEAKLALLSSKSFSSIAKLSVLQEFTTFRLSVNSFALLIQIIEKFYLKLKMDLIKFSSTEQTKLNLKQVKEGTNYMWIFFFWYFLYHSSIYVKHQFKDSSDTCHFYFHLLCIIVEGNYFFFSTFIW